MGGEDFCKHAAVGPHGRDHGDSIEDVERKVAAEPVALGRKVDRISRSSPEQERKLALARAHY